MSARKRYLVPCRPSQVRAMMTATCDNGPSGNFAWRIALMDAIRIAAFFIVLGFLATSGCSTAPPHSQQNLCAIFDQYPEWYDAAKDSEQRWGTPAHILMSFVRHESAFVEDAKPPRNWFLFVPLPRGSSAEGYAQAQDPAWDEYQEENGGLFKSRSDMQDALDFIGWYNHKSSSALGISKWDPKNLYLAYHEGRTGYSRGSFNGKPSVVRVAERVDWQAREYGAQLRQCEERFQCRRWYQVGPFCSI
ncbi:MAG TPA: hypothetical protein VIV14_12400 [Gammaproteobacteria bacterium]